MCAVLEGSSLDCSKYGPLIAEGLKSAARALSLLVGDEARVTINQINRVTIGSILGTVAEPEAVVRSCCLQVTGDLNGQILVVFPPEAATRFAMLLEPACTDPAMEESVILEAANIVGSSFLNTLADRIGVCLSPIPPVAATDMAGAIVETLVAADLGRRASDDDLNIVDAEMTLTSSDVAFRVVIIQEDANAAQNRGCGIGRGAVFGKSQ